MGAHSSLVWSETLWGHRGWDPHANERRCTALVSSINCYGGCLPIPPLHPQPLHEVTRPPLLADRESVPATKTSYIVIIWQLRDLKIWCFATHATHNRDSNSVQKTSRIVAFPPGQSFWNASLHIPSKNGLQWTGMTVLPKSVLNEVKGFENLRCL